MAQFARPNADTSIGSWDTDGGSTTNIYQSIDEATASDTDFIRSENNPSNSDCKIGLSSVTDPASSSGHIVRYRFRREDTGGGSAPTVTIIVFLYQGTTLIATGSTETTTTTFADGSFTLTGGEADSITDYSALHLTFRANKSSGSRTSRGEISWAELEVPDSAGTYTASGSVTVAVTTASGSATFDAGTFTASGSVTTAAATVAGTAEHPSLATGSVTTGAATVAGTVAFGYHPVGHISQLGLTATPTSPYGSFAGRAPDTYSASGSVTVAAATAVGAATFDAGTFTASAAITLAAATAAGTATFDPGTFTGTGSVTIAAATAAGTATFDAGTYEATGAIALDPSTVAGTATFATAQVFASGAITLAAATAAGAATFDAGSYAASGAIALDATTAAGTATFTVGTFTATGAVTLGATTLAASATFDAGAYAAAGAIDLAAVTVTGTSSFSLAALKPTRHYLKMAVQHIFDMEIDTIIDLVVDHRFVMEATDCTGDIQDPGGQPPGTSSASGSITLEAITLSGTASSAYGAIGSVVLVPIVVAGTASSPFTGTGAITVAAATVAGTVAVVNNEYFATGAVTIAAAVVTGTATSPFTATGTVALSPAQVSGTATSAFVATGAITTAAATVSGTMQHPSQAIGTITTAAATVAGTATNSGGQTPLNNPSWVVADYGADWSQVELMGLHFNSSTYETVFDETNVIEVTNSTELLAAINTARTNSSINAIHCHIGTTYSLGINAIGTFTRPRSNPLVIRTKPGSASQALFAPIDERKGPQGIAFVDLNLCPNWPAAGAGSLSLIGEFGLPTGRAPKYILIEKCKVWPSIQGVNLGGPNPPPEGPAAEHWAIRLCWICDHWNSGSSLPHGLYCWNQKDGLFEANFVDHNGWDPAHDRSWPSTSGGPNTRRHNLYLNRPGSTDFGGPVNSQVIVRYNIIARGSGNAIQGKCAYDARQNLFILNPVNQMGYGGDGQFGAYGQIEGGIFRDNVTLDTDVVTTGSPRGAHLWTTACNNLTILDNVCIDSTQAVKSNECGFYFEQDFPITAFAIENYKQWSWAGTKLFRGNPNFTPDFTETNVNYNVASYGAVAKARSNELKSSTWLDDHKNNLLGVDIGELQSDLALIRSGLS